MIIEEIIQESEPIDPLAEHLFRDAPDRIGLMYILPEGLFFDEEELKNPKLSTEALFNKHKKKKDALEEFFYQNFDKRVFQTELRWEKKVSEIEENINTLVLKELFGIDLSEETEPEIRKLARLIPGGQCLKGNVKMLALVSQNILEQEVEVSVSGNKVLFTVMIDGLESKQYQERKSSLKPFFDKLFEWFLPYDCICTYEIKAHKRHMKLGEKLILGYNTRLWKRG